MCRLLPERLPEAVVLEADILWRDEFAQPEDNYRTFYEMWLRLCKNIAQSGRPVVLFSAGGIPGNIEPCSERRYLATVHYLALTCAEEVLLARLRRRPTWRGSADEAHLAAQVQFNRWLCAVGGSGTPPIALLDTTQTTVEATTAQVAAWARRIIAPGAL